MTLYPHSFKSLSYDPVGDFAPVSMLITQPNMMCVPNSSPAKSVKEFIDFCNANKGKVTFASSGNGTTLHLSGELFKRMAKVEMTHIPYRGGAPAINDLIPGRVDVIFDNMPSIISHVRGGSVRGLAVTTKDRVGIVPDVPAISETVPGFESVGFYGISAPKGTPPEIVDILNKAVNEALKDPKLVERLTEVGGIPKPMTPAEFGKLLSDETEKWRKVVEFAGVSVD